ncbi:MAG: disulfide oxidoreductase [Patescibacteria group bacterium]|nr:disulfide oxidoreductase [Patescibacteria group bacterium]
MLNLLAFLTLVADLLIGFIFLGLLASRINKDANRFFSKTIKLINRNFLILGFIIACFATLGSLYFSEIAGFIPCRLCWFQRIFMYPQSVLFLIAYIKKDKNIFNYTLYLSLIGAVISLYHIYVQRFVTVAVCAIGESCTTNFFTYFGYITIPVMSLTAFILILILSILKKKEVK